MNPRVDRGWGRLRDWAPAGFTLRSPLENVYEVIRMGTTKSQPWLMKLAALPNNCPPREVDHRQDQKTQRARSGRNAPLVE